MNLPQGLEDIFFKMYKCFIFDDRYTMFAKGLGNTLLLTFFALLIGIALGVVVALIRVTWDKNSSEMSGFPKVVLCIANLISKLYLTVIRGTPVVVQIMLMYFVFCAAVRDKILVGCLCFGINSGAYVAEIFRSGIMSIDAGQMEAGRSLGFGYIPTMRHIILPQAFKNVLPPLCNEFIVLLKETAVVGYIPTMRHIILPQAFKNVLPPLCNEFIVLLKETAVVGYIGLADLTYSANTVGGTTYEYLFPLLLAAVIYLIMVLFFTYLVGKLERRLRTSER